VGLGFPTLELEHKVASPFAAMIANRPRPARVRQHRRLGAAAALGAVLTVVAAGKAFLPGPQRPSRTTISTSRSSSSSAPRVQRGVLGLDSQQSGFQQVDGNYNPTWGEIDKNDIRNLDWANQQTFWATAATGLFSYDLWRFFNLVPSTSLEVVAAGIIYAGLYMSRYQDVAKMDKHYQISFYASCGWTLYAFVSLIHAHAYSPDPVLSRGISEALHGGACAVYLGSCVYFYAYHWGRMWRHFQEDRFRPWFAAGLASLTAVHGLTVGHIYKVLDDPGWWPTVTNIYPDEWRFLADTRLVELYLTAAALFLVICHLRGVMTGTKNAALVFLGTIILPTLALFGECFHMNACVWYHYFMVGPKYW